MEPKKNKKETHKTNPLSKTPSAHLDYEKFFCKIITTTSTNKNDYPTGFFCKIPISDNKVNKEYIYCLISEYHVINENNIISKDIYIEYLKQQRSILKIEKNTRFYREKKFDITLVEILPPNISSYSFLEIKDESFLKDDVVKYCQNMNIILHEYKNNIFTQKTCKLDDIVKPIKYSFEGPVILAPKKEEVGKIIGFNRNKIKDVLPTQKIVVVSLRPFLEDVKKFLNNFKTIENKQILYMGKVENGRKVKGVIYYKNEDYTVYYGAFKNDEKEGFGIELKNKDEWYKGDWVKGKRSGSGIYSFKNGDLYDGSWKNGVKEGRGKYIFANGDLFIGNWTNGLKNGKGMFIAKDGYKYVGEWKDDLRQGKGIEYLTVDDEKNKEKFFGSWKDNHRNGLGHYYYKNEDIYKGNWKNDKKDGMGNYISDKGRLMIDQNDDVYPGFVLNESYIYQNNYDSYSGSWKNGVKEGNGKYTFSNGDVLIGHWSNGLKNGKGMLISKDGYKYIGEWKDDNREGKGIEYFTRRNEMYFGYWALDNKEGQGNYYYKNGDKYKGSWKKNEKCGKGTYISSNGKIVNYGEENEQEEDNVNLIVNNPKIKKKNDSDLK